MKLFLNAAAKFISGVVLTLLCLFLPAGTLYYPRGWLFCVLLFVPMLFLGMALFLFDPELLEKRLKTKEASKHQLSVVAASGLLIAAVMVLAGLDYRYGWTNGPKALSFAAAAVLLAAYAMYAEVMRENRFLSRTVEIQTGQKVIDTGLYGVIRHPMYTATIFLFSAMALVLGSWISFGLSLLYPALIVIRLKNEEELLDRELEGYSQYKKTVRYRLIPFLW